MSPVIRPAHGGDFGALLALAGEVEHWFGAMVEEPGFHRALREHIDAGMALVAESGPESGRATAPESGRAADSEADSEVGQQLVGGLLFGSEPPVYHIHWLVVSERARGRRLGRALVEEAVRHYVTPPGTLDVVTFGADHPGATVSGARVFYERLGFAPAESAPPGPEGGARQHYRRAVDGPGPLVQPWPMLPA